MKHWWKLGLILTALAVTPAFPAAGKAAAGKTLYAKHCATCHGASGEGKESLAKALKTQMRPLRSKEVQANNDAQWRKDIVEGTGKMKPVKGLSQKQTDDVIAYLRTLAKK